MGGVGGKTPNTTQQTARAALPPRNFPKVLVVVIIRGLALLALAYLLFCGLLFLIQERLIFFPQRDPPGTRYAFSMPSEEVWIAVDGAQLHALWFRVPVPQGVILYMHGNAGSLRSWGAVGADLAQRGYDVLIVDYRGYGQSSGQISSEAQLHADMAAVYAWVLTQYPADQVVLYGRSLGSGLAVRLAAEQQPRLLILESPFDSLETLARRQFPFVPPFVLRYPLRSTDWIGAVHAPVLIIHGTADEVVPFAAGERLAAQVRAPLQFVAVPGGRHNNLAQFAAYTAALDEALGRLDDPGASP